MNERSILLLDFDGVIGPVTDTDPKTWAEWRVDRTNGFSIRWSPDMIAALTSLTERVEIRWLTTWWDMTDRLSFLGLQVFPVANTREEYLDRDGGPMSWWKLTTARRVYGEGRPVIWIDDDLGFDEAAIRWGRSLPKGTLLGICPRSCQGVTPGHISTIHEWLDELPP